MTYYWDMDGVLANFHKAYAADKATALKREAMANLEPFFANVNTLRDLIAAGHTCYILTKAANADGAQGKVEWLAKYVPEMDADHTIILTKGRKVDAIREDGILVDDDPANTRQWGKGWPPGHPHHPGRSGSDLIRTLFCWRRAGGRSAPSLR